MLQEKNLKRSVDFHANFTCGIVDVFIREEHKKKTKTILSSFTNSFLLIT